MEHFVAGTTARTAARLVRVNKTTAAYYYHRLRELIYQAIADAAPLAGEIEVDESYFGGHRKGKRGRGAAGRRRGTGAAREKRRRRGRGRRKRGRGAEEKGGEQEFSMITIFPSL